MSIGNKQTQEKVGDDVFPHLSNKHIIDNKGLNYDGVWGEEKKL